MNTSEEVDALKNRVSALERQVAAMEGTPKPANRADQLLDKWDKTVGNVVREQRGCTPTSTVKGPYTVEAGTEIHGHPDGSIVVVVDMRARDWARLLNDAYAAGFKSGLASP